jgi:hypothetical protein
MNTLTFVFHDSSFLSPQDTEVYYQTGWIREMIGPTHHLTNRALPIPNSVKAVTCSVSVQLNAFGVESAESTFSFCDPPALVSDLVELHGCLIARFCWSLCGLWCGDCCTCFSARKTPLGYDWLNSEPAS